MDASIDEKTQTQNPTFTEGKDHIAFIEIKIDRNWLTPHEFKQLFFIQINSGPRSVVAESLNHSGGRFHEGANTLKGFHPHLGDLQL